jgi:hypothetical protein
MEEFCSGMPPSYSQLKPESTASHITVAGRLKDGDEGVSKLEFWLPFLPGVTWDTYIFVILKETFFFC